MKIALKIASKVDAKNNYGIVLVESERVFNFDALAFEHTTEEKKFLSTLEKNKWTKIPEDLLDITTAQNFYCYAKLPNGENFREA